LRKFQFTPFELPEAAKALRHEVRAFLDAEMPKTAAATKARSWSGGAAEFSRKLGERGWLGMTLPRKYGGHERSYAERYVVIEELLVAGAPVGLHWVADRQSGPLILRYGTEDQRLAILPKIARGEAFFCIGMSEPGSGSDLASVRTRARKVDGGWRINGQKIWTSTAQHAHYMIALVRTGDGETRHAGLSQFIVDMRSDGLTVKPIANLTGESHFNEVFFDDVFVPDSMLIGNEGGGWQQVTAELAYERSGPERYLSSIRLFLEFLRVTGDAPSELEKQLIGRMTAEMWTLRHMSLSVMGKLAAGEDPAVEAAVVKDLGTSLEQETPRLIQANTRSDITLEDGNAFDDTLSYLLQSSPSFSLRGGTREILRGIIARELGLR
jgi:alkylation response protein AidB-like acyl-CoA dehydrogenase